MSTEAKPTTNYEVRIASYGKYAHGDVIPASAILAHGTDPAELVAAGILGVSEKPVNCQIHPATPAVNPSEVIFEMAKLREALDSSRREAAQAKVRVDELERILAHRERETNAQGLKISALEATAANLDAQNATLAKTLADRDAELAIARQALAATAATGKTSGGRKSVPA